MAYSNTAAVLRGDITTMLMEAAQADTMFIGDKVFPMYPSTVKAGQFPKFKLATGELLNNDATLRTPTDEYSKITRAYEIDTFTCVDRGLEELIDDSYARDISRFFDAEVGSARNALRNVKMGSEIRVAAQVMSATNFTATAAAVAYTESNIATIAFHRDVLGAVDRLNAKGIYPNAVVMSGPLFNRISRSTLAQNYIRGAGKSTDATMLLTPGALANSLTEYTSISQCLVGKVNYNSAKKGQAFSATPVWGNTYLWVGRIEAGDFMNGGAGRQIVWTEDAPDLFITETYRNENRRSDAVRVRQNVIEKVIDPTGGELITTSYS